MSSLRRLKRWVCTLTRLHHVHRCWNLSIYTSCLCESLIQSKFLSESFQLPDEQPACWHALFELNKLTKICKQHKPSYLTTNLTHAWIKHRTTHTNSQVTPPPPHPLLSVFLILFYFCILLCTQKQFLSSWSNFVVSGVWQKHGLTSTQYCGMHNRLCYSSELFMPICVL